MTNSYDPILLTSFLTVAEARGFSEAARRLDLGQSTVSQHIRKLEAATGRALFQRDTHSVALTPDGDAMVEFARSILDANARAASYFAGASPRGRLRFGASEDFALSDLLPDVLGAFTREHPMVDLELTVGLAENLYDRLDAGDLDLLFAKRRAGDERGTPVWRERLIWVGAADWVHDPDRPLPLILFPPPSVTRAAVISAVARERMDWRLACTCGSLAGLRAAMLAGLGVSAQSETLIADGLSDLSATPGLPALGETEFVVVRRQPTARGPAAALEATLVAAGRRFHASRTAQAQL